LEGLIDAGLNERFRFASQFLPKPFSEAFAELLARAGFSVILSCESFADEVLEQNGMSYRAADMLETIKRCEALGLDTTVDLIFGLPGETLATVDHSLAMMEAFPTGPLRRYEYTFGGRIYPGTPLCAYVEQHADPSHLYGMLSQDRLSPQWYCAPLPPKQLKAYVDERFAHPIGFANRIAEDTFQILAVLHTADGGNLHRAVGLFLDADAAVQAACFDPLFRRLSDAGAVAMGRAVIEEVLSSAQNHPETPGIAEAAGLAGFYLNMIP
jgi:hypothetical protein